MSVSWYSTLSGEIPTLTSKSKSCFSAMGKTRVLILSTVLFTFSCGLMRKLKTPKAEVGIAFTLTPPDIMSADCVVEMDAFKKGTIFKVMSRVF